MAQDKGPVTAADAADALMRGLAAAEILLGRPDQDGSMSSVMTLKPHSAEPWNSAAGVVVMTAHQGLRDLENEVQEMAGLPVRGRGGSVANTYAALNAIVILAENISPHARREVTRKLFGWAGGAERLPAVDERARWLPIRAGDDAPACPSCGTYSLRLSERSLIIACFYPACPRPDDDDGGLRILGRLAWSAVTAEPVLIWADDRPAA